jgi:transcriptional regulator with XRE-family HTH domain
MSLGEFVKKTREARGLTQHELAAVSELPRGYISQVELDNIKEASASKMLKLAKALRVKPEELYAAAGYIREGKTEYQAPPTPDEALKILNQTLPAQIPVYASISDKRPLYHHLINKSLLGGREKLLKGFISSIDFAPDIKKGDLLLCSQREPRDNDLALYEQDGIMTVVPFNKKIKGNYYLVDIIHRQLFDINRP